MSYIYTHSPQPTEEWTTTVEVCEYDEDGRLVKRTTTTTKSRPNPTPSSPQWEPPLTWGEPLRITCSSSTVGGTWSNLDYATHPANHAGALS